MNRRHAIRTAAAGAALLLPRRAAAGDHPGQELRRPLDWDGVAPLTVDEATLEVWTGRSTAVLAVNGMVPGPTIRVRPGQTFEATVSNRLAAEDLVLHWHGIEAPAATDGHPRQAIAPGGSYQVSIPIHQQPSLCWYHAHTHSLTAAQVYRGIAGLFIVDDPERDAALGLPTGVRDVPLVIRDWKSNASYALTYAPSMFEHMWGYLGDTILVNGTPSAWMAVDQGLWRFRLLNACNARVLRIGFSDARPMHVFASDGGLTGILEQVTAFDLAPGQRAEILVSFAGLAVGSSTVLRSLSFSIVAPGGGPAGPRQGNPLDIMTCHVDSAGGPVAMPGTLPAPVLPDPAAARRTRTFALGVAAGVHTINGLSYSLARIDFQVPCGEVEIWEFVNQTQNHHPMHAHAAFFRVLTRNGAPATLPMDRGWRDTVLVYPNETVRVAIVFGPRPGEFLLHCHNLEHEHQMMQNFLVLPPETPPVSVRKDGGDVVVSWPAPADGWRLHRSSDLADWTPIDGAPVLSGNALTWREPIGTEPRFYRLAKP